METNPLQDSLLPILRCPFCGGGFSFDEKPRPTLGRAEFGLLQCGCSVFPVVDGIPVIQRAPVGMFEHTRGTQQTEGIGVDALVRRIRDGDSLDALLECLAVPELPQSWRSAMGWRLSHSRFAARAARARGKRALRRRVLAQRDTIGGRDVLEFYYLSGGPLDREMGHYFICRFGQPRHLAALALAASIPSASKPILDIACGIGHLEHYFGCRHDATPTVGLDMNFSHLWIARHWMAPSGNYVCGNATDGLPFADDAFSAAICSDAYHYIDNRQRLLREIDRCAPGRVVVLTRVGNAAVMPNEGKESTFPDYLDEIGRTAAARAFDEAELVRCYLRRVDPFTQPVATDLQESKWLTFAWNLPGADKRTLVSDAVAPHAVGQVGVNPIYAQTPGPGGSLHLRFQFPAIWFAYENHAMLDYHPRDASIPRDEVPALSSWQTREALHKLVDAFVLLGMPHRFNRSDHPSVTLHAP